VQVWDIGKNGLKQTCKPHARLPSQGLSLFRRIAFAPAPRALLVHLPPMSARAASASAPHPPRYYLLLVTAICLGLGLLAQVLINRQQRALYRHQALLLRAAELDVIALRQQLEAERILAAAQARHDGRGAASEKQ
jgi:hypothetical protein